MITYAIGSHHAPDLIASGVILRREVANGDRWLLLRAAKHREWGFPKGHQDEGETLIATALRECAEETGIALLAIEGDPFEVHYRLPSGRSKAVVYFPAVTATAKVALSSEHLDYDWFTASQVVERLLHPTLCSLFKAYLTERRNRTGHYARSR